MRSGAAIDTSTKCEHPPHPSSHPAAPGYGDPWDRTGRPCPYAIPPPFAHSMLSGASLPRVPWPLLPRSFRNGARVSTALPASAMRARGPPRHGRPLNPRTAMTFPARHRWRCVEQVCELDNGPKHDEARQRDGGAQPCAPLPAHMPCAARERRTHRRPADPALGAPLGSVARPCLFAPILMGVGVYCARWVGGQQWLGGQHG
mmetsp:Transcript_45776/g.145915  ORF Transcript_45776/g.145915 Transcript_45776/m.145915 type:complete len:203 (-) Transcript_45776:580-1188(-)